MKAITITIGGKTLYLTYTGEAMFGLREKYGEPTEMLEKMSGDTKESFDITCDVIATLAEQGELVRRYYGHTPQDIVSFETIKLLTQPKDIFTFKLIIPRVVTLGFSKEIIGDNDDEVDLGLLELNQKKTI